MTFFTGAGSLTLNISAPASRPLPAVTTWMSPVSFSRRSLRRSTAPKAPMGASAGTCARSSLGSILARSTVVALPVMPANSAGGGAAANEVAIGVRAPLAQRYMFMPGLSMRIAPPAVVKSPNCLMSSISLAMSFVLAMST
jgi:hypothetical protein